MLRVVISIQVFLAFFALQASGQVKIRLFAAKPLHWIVFNVNEGSYRLDFYDDAPIYLKKGDNAIVSFYNGKVAVKTKGDSGFTCDSMVFTGQTGQDLFSVRVGNEPATGRIYDGDLQCIHDLGFLVLINTCNIDRYIAGVVQAEGGTGKNIEYIKSQALIARTYMYRYLNKHIIDGYNLCDGTHCQAYMGNSQDPAINRAVLETTGLVVLGRDSLPIMSAFHSNCGGETESSENVWLSGQPYLKKVVDPYCTGSRNAKWTKSITVKEWKDYLRNSGFTTPEAGKPDLNFSQITRQKDYRTGSFSLPFTKIRDDFNLKSSFFSVVQSGDSMIFRGKGYGHGVGLCQEGAMVMAAQGKNYRQILQFYYSNIIISDIRNAKNPAQ
ncbi:MAG TPA: SpoIID/LytB domain-containing protein [Bacteroidales bacterium]|nr:SpoIID/LytB domain-containing protein [Bacteroidales bacterium]HNR42926.1 SpoIID/LytB domain-containing protein [Bacteroidales bacterium]HPM18600.1 SpoIID/LytB domain-containing protein [Bacteroidales bacterium]HQG76319.1 SpoIID/LytB domain-containing protein [Bacteroidales bacterium]